MLCEYCGSPVEEGAKSCGKCGAYVRPVKNTAAVTASAAVQPEPEVPREPEPEPEPEVNPFTRFSGEMNQYQNSPAERTHGRGKLLTLLVIMLIAAAVIFSFVKRSQGADMDLSAGERPSLEDFLWYGEDVMYNGIPNNATPIKSIDRLNGRWKALIISDPYNEMDSYCMQLLNADIRGNRKGVILTLDWYLFWTGNYEETRDETNMKDSVFSGQWKGGGLWASGAGTVRLTHFYELNLRQYAVGTMDSPDGTPTVIALVRP